MQTWLQGLYHKGEYLMVRSTGARKMKRKKNKNSKGVKYLMPEAMPARLMSPVSGPFLLAWAVIRSYFSVTSLKNRIEAGNNPFEQSLKA